MPRHRPFQVKAEGLRLEEQLRSTLREANEHPRLARIGARHQEVQCGEGLAGAGTTGEKGRRVPVQAAPEHHIQLG